MINSDFLIWAGIVTALLWIPAGIKLYKKFVPLHWLFAPTFIFGSLGIAYFYYEISYGLIGGLNLAAVSRILWSLILWTTAVLAVSVLVYRQ